MKRVKAIAVLLAGLMFTGFLPLLKGAFKNDLSFDVRVRLFNPKHELYNEFSIPANAVRYSKVINGTAAVYNKDGKVVCRGQIVSPSKITGYYDNKKKMFYYLITPTQVAAIRPADVKDWKMP